MKLKQTILIIFLAALIILPLALNAESYTGNSQLDAFQSASGLAGENSDENSIAVIVGNVIQVVLGFVGLIFLILIIYSGFQWMTAGGNSDTITKAKDRMINATIGLVIVLAAYTITWFITDIAFNTVEGS